MFQRKFINHKCVVKNCNNSSFTHPEYAYFAITNNAKRRIEWLLRIGRMEWVDEPSITRFCRVCETHFSPEDITYRSNRNFLKNSALPTRRLPGQYDTRDEENPEPGSSRTINPTSNLTQNTFEGGAEITNTVSNNPDLTINYSKYGNKIHELCDMYLTEDLSQLVKAYAYISAKSERNQHKYRILCWNLFQSSPKAYQFLQAIFEFPTAISLLKQYIPSGTAINCNLMLTLKTRVDKMSKKEKNCSLLIGSIGLKASLCYNIKEDKIIGFEDINNVQYPKPIKMARIIMIRGILSRWKQPVGYLLIPQCGYNNKIRNYIEIVLKYLSEIGLNVRAVISSLDDDIVNESQWIAKSVENPFFIINGKKIYHIYDATDLIKSVRDNLMVNDFHFQGNIATYGHIVEFYNADQKKSTKQLTHKLAKRHITPTDAEMGQVEYAIQLLSGTVASGLWNYANFKLIDEKGKETAEFIYKINNLFDMLNSTNRINEDNEYKKAFSGNEAQKLFFEEMIDLFQNLKIVNPYGEDVTLNTKFINAFLITIKSIFLLFDDLKTEGHTFLPTRNLHSDSLKNFCTQMGTRGPKLLTSQQFITNYRKLSFAYLLKFTLAGSNNEGELNKCIRKIYDQKEMETEASPATTISPNPIPCNNDGDIKIHKWDYKEIDTPEKHSLLYVCGYLLLKSRENHDQCQILLDYMRNVNNAYPNSSVTYTRYRRYEHPEKLLAVPCDGFVNFVKQMDSKFVEAFEAEQICCKIVGSVCDAIQQIDYKFPCPCFPRTYVTKLFLRIKIFYTIRFNNRYFRKMNGIPKLTVPSL